MLDETLERFQHTMRRKFRNRSYTLRADRKNQRKEFYKRCIILWATLILEHFRNKLIFYGEELLDPRSTPKLEDYPCRLSATAYSIYSQLPTISGGRLLHPQSEDAPCRADKGPVEDSCEPWGSIKYWEVLEWLHNWQLLKKDSRPWVSDIYMRTERRGGGHTGCPETESK
jgi:hypothetical protein